MARYKLQLKRLDFVSVVDSPAQEPATCLLIKRHGAGHEISATAKFVKASLGLAFFWAVKATDVNGDAYHDLQGDQVLADDDMVKAAMEFMERGAAVDQQHDRDQIGKAIFMMPMTAEIATAYGISTKQSGLMVALKPSPDVMKKLLDGTYTGVSIEGIGERAEIKSAPTGKCTAGHAMPVDKAACPDCGAKMAKRLVVAKFAGGMLRVLKESVLTSETDGHVHAIDLDDPATAWMDMYSTSYQTVEGAENGHSHSWTFDPLTGVITIGADSGHDHTVAAVVPPDALAAYAALDAAKDRENAAVAAEIADAPSDAVPMLVTDEKSSGAINVTIIAARAPAGKSTPSRPVKHAANTPEEHAVDELKKQLAEAVAKLTRVERIAKMSGAHKTHFDSLAGDDAEAFLAKSTADREVIVGAEIAKRGEADKIVYTSKSTGDVYRTKDDPRLVDMAKRMDAQLEEVAKAEIATIAKSHLGTLAGDDEIHQYVIASCRKGGADAAKLEKVFTAMKGWYQLGVTAAKARGVNPGSDAPAGDKASTYEALSKGLVEFAKKNSITKVWTDGLNAFIETPEGAALKTAYDNATQAS